MQVPRKNPQFAHREICDVSLGAVDRLRAVIEKPEMRTVLQAASSPGRIPRDRNRFGVSRRLRMFSRALDFRFVDAVLAAKPCLRLARGIELDHAAIVVAWLRTRACGSNVGGDDRDQKQGTGNRKRVAHGRTPVVERTSRNADCEQKTAHDRSKRLSSGSQQRRSLWRPPHDVVVSRFGHGRGQGRVKSDGSRTGSGPLRGRIVTLPILKQLQTSIRNPASSSVFVSDENESTLAVV